jgi:hypothetical protein
LHEGTKDALVIVGGKMGGVSVHGSSGEQTGCGSTKPIRGLHEDPPPDAPDPEAAPDPGAAPDPEAGEAPAPLLATSWLSSPPHAPSVQTRTVATPKMTKREPQCG